MLAALVTAAVVSPPAIAQADDPPPPPLRQVKYTVWTEQPYNGAEVFYRDADPPNWAEYRMSPRLCPTFASKCSGSLLRSARVTVDGDSEDTPGRRCSGIGEASGARRARTASAAVAFGVCATGLTMPGPMRTIRPKAIARFRLLRISLSLILKFGNRPARSSP